MTNSISTIYCILGSSFCRSMTEWQEMAQVLAIYVAVPGVLLAAYKAIPEISKLRQERGRERLSRIHALQLESLRKLYEQLDLVQGYSQLMTKRAVFEGEKPEEYPVLLGSALVAARREFVSARLLLPSQLTSLIEAFFQKVVETQVNFGVAQRMLVNGTERAQYWDKAGTISHQEMPALLTSIENAARAIIGSEGG